MTECRSLWNVVARPSENFVFSAHFLAQTPFKSTQKQCLTSSKFTNNGRNIEKGENLVPKRDYKLTQFLHAKSKQKITIFHFQTTGLTGLVVSQNPHYYLTSLYGKILRAVSKMPQDAAYRKYTEQIVNDRLKAVQTVSSHQNFNSAFHYWSNILAQRR